MKAAVLSIFFLMFLAGCDTIPQSVRDGYELPTSLEMCHTVYIDANDRLYLKDIQIKELEAQVKELKK